MKLLALCLVAFMGLATTGLSSQLFFYNKMTGKCEDSHGKSGLNTASLSIVIATANGECADLSFLQDVWSDKNEITYTGWNLKGANLNHASILNVVLKSADLSGADMRGLKGGYSYFEGTVDLFTRLPDPSLGGHRMGNVDWTPGFPEIIGTECVPIAEHIDCGLL